MFRIKANSNYKQMQHINQIYNKGTNSLLLWFQCLIMAFPPNIEAIQKVMVQFSDGSAQFSA